MWCRHVICRYLICRHIWGDRGATYDVTTSIWPKSGCRHLAISGADIWLPMFGMPRPDHWRLGSLRLRGHIWVSGIWMPWAYIPAPGAWIWAPGSGCRGLGSRHLGGGMWGPRGVIRGVSSGRRTLVTRHEACGRQTGPARR